MLTVTLEQFHAQCKEQAGSTLDTVVICPACKTLQCGHDFIAAGVEPERVPRVLGLNCVGRYTGAPSARKVPDGQPCNWSLVGLFQIHTMEVIDADGVKHPHFELASVEQAQQYRESRASVAQPVKEVANGQA